LDQQNLFPRPATDDFQRDYTGQVIDDSRGNWVDVARALKLDSGNLHRLAKRLGLNNQGKSQ
jgi:anaerobic nitric oxide reductase transcription regulator